MQLFGVEHGARSFLGQDLEVHPSSQMIGLIAELPKGSTVGLETTPEILTSESFGDGHRFPDEATSYWRDIAEWCSDLGHTVVHLDDIDLHIEIAKARHEEAKLKEELSVGDVLEHMIHGLVYGPRAEEERERRELLYGVSMKVEDLFKIKREDAIFDKLRAHTPDAAIIGVAHADYLVLAKDEGCLVGVPSPSSYRQVRNIYPPDGYIEGSVLQETVPGVPDTQVLNDREAIIRRFRAVELGRILVGAAQPADWVGSWNMYCRPEGLFELRIEGNDGEIKSGTIEDVLGTALFEGTFLDDEIEFDKSYVPGRIIDQGVASGVISHTATRVSEDEYHGTCCVRDEEFTVDFVLKRGSSLGLPDYLSALDG